MDWQHVCGYGATACLTIYQVPQVARIVRRRSAEDFSIPAYLLVLAGLTLYSVATWGGPAWLPSLASLTNASVMLGVVLYYRGARRRGNDR